MAVSPFKLDELSRLLDQGQFARAEAELLKLGRVSPGDPNLAMLLVTLFAQTGRFDQAVFAAERRAALLPDDLGAQSGLVDMLLAAKQPDKAIARARKIFERGKNSPRNVLVLASVLLHVGRVAESAQILEERLAAGLWSSDLAGTRASALLATGRTTEAAAGLREILRREPGHPFALSLLATVLNYVPGADPGEIFRVHQEYGSAMTKFAARGGFAPAPARVPREGRALNVGFVSSDLHEHSVSRFVEPILRHADRGRTRLILISMGMNRDAMSRRLSELCDAWRDLRPLSWDTLRRIVAEEKIDVLIELGGHMVNTPLPLLIPRQAPLQGSAIGYPNTTGLPTIDFRIVDSITDPPGEADGRATERLVRVDPCFLCFQPPTDAPDVAVPPFERNGHVTFGSFNSLSKVNEELLRDWAEILGRVPNSRFLLKALALDDPGTREDVAKRLARAGIPADRVRLLGKLNSTREHLECYGEIDIALDTYPYHGTTTTCEALWMGVPVVSRGGATHASRVGASLLRAVGLPDFVAGNRQEYLAIATKLAGDGARRASLRKALREQVRSSSLCDGAAYARRWEAAVTAQFDLGARS